LLQDAPEVGFRRLIGVRVLDVRENEARIAVEITEDLLNPAGACHGGVVGAILDSVMGNAIDGILVPGRVGQFAVTVESKVNYLASVPPGPVTASARVLSNDGELAVIEAELLRHDGKRAAFGLATFMITRPPGSSMSESAAGEDTTSRRRGGGQGR
jgi:uncharacterized protein (TIGR00369 family)